MNSIRLRSKSLLKSFDIKDKEVKSHRDYTEQLLISNKEKVNLRIGDLKGKHGVIKLVSHHEHTLTSRNSLCKVNNRDKIDMSYITVKDKRYRCYQERLVSIVKDNTHDFPKHHSLVSDRLLFKNSIRFDKLKDNKFNNEKFFDYNNNSKPIELTTKETKLYNTNELKGFQLKHIIGKAGCSIVWFATDIDNQKYAIKQILKQGHCHSKDLRNTSNAFTNNQSAKREIEMMNHIFPLLSTSDTNAIVSYKKVYESPKFIWIIMPQSGHSLSKLSFKITKSISSTIQERIYDIKQSLFYHKLITDLNQFKFLIKSLLSFIQFTSSNGIIHSDIKPDNILITYDNYSYAIKEVKVIDFGSAFFIENPINFNSNTPEYMSPEVVSIIDHSISQSEITDFIKTLIKNPSCIDMWSLGVTLLEIALACPIWISYNSRVFIGNRIIQKKGLFGFKGRELSKIYTKQIAVSNDLHCILKDSAIEDIIQRNQFEDLLKQMLNIDYGKRITPNEALSHPFLT